MDLEMRRVKTSLALTIDGYIWVTEVQFPCCYVLQICGPATDFEFQEQLDGKLRDIRLQYKTLQDFLEKYALALVQ